MIKLQYNQATGALLVAVEAEDELLAISQMAFFQSLPKVCPTCNAAVRLFHKQPQQYDYYGLKCDGQVVHSCNFGQRRDNKRLYYKGPSSWEVSQGREYHQEEEREEFRNYSQERNR